MFDGQSGKVVDFNWSMTTIKLWDGTQLVIPNSVIQTHQFQRLIGEYRANVKVRIDYKIPPEKIKNVLISSVPIDDNILTTPLPFVWMERFEDYYIEYTLYFWLRNYESIFDMSSVVMTNVWYGLKRENIEIPLPIQNLKLLKEKKVDQSEIIKHRVELVNNVEIFKTLDTSIKQEISEVLQEKIYAPGEAIIIQGHTGGSFYIITEGAVRVIVTDTNAGSQTVAVLSTGNYFGEMSLLTGEPCSATVKTGVETKVLVLDKTEFRKIMHNTPSLADKLAKILSERLEVLSETKESLQQEVIQKQQTTFAERIRNFFGLK